jgi:rubrerythrin
MSKSNENLLKAFAGESQANRKYLAFAKKAQEDEKEGVAKLFRVAAEGETVHALNHLRTTGGVKDTAENLKEAISGETYEINEMYPEFLAGAKEEGDKGAERSFDIARKVEMTHKNFFEKALEKLEAGEEVEVQEYYVCSVCGYPATPEAPEVCPVCGAKKEMFREVE